MCCMAVFNRKSSAVRNSVTFDPEMSFSRFLESADLHYARLLFFRRCVEQVSISLEIVME